MVHLLLTALALSADGFSAGISFGLRKIKIGWKAKSAIALTSFVFALVSLRLGAVLGGLVSPAAAPLLGAGILVLMGLWVMLGAFKKSPAPPPGKETDADPPAVSFLGTTAMVLRDPQTGDLDCSGSIDLKEAFLLAFSLSLDMLGAGVGISLSGTAGHFLPVAIGLSQGLVVAFGQLAGQTLAQKLPGKTTVAFLSGLVLFGLGITRFFLS
ncbi:manganese efflux pump [Youxingia wuxianensis]|uniref:Manganese efflux pump n=1 Tax=Youxingia wuxianensis TaxID=2763678 RepID=A0A926IIQ9_9FIRM|nr:manganese efflux pump [Youxingia wuxianensis]MBC8586455.1 manganese efflux pump [Youxingia wuxianensis]